MAKATDKKTIELIKEVKRRKEEIARIEKPNWKTNCSFPWVEGKMNEAVNIHVENDIRKLVLITGYLLGKAEEYRSGLTALAPEIADPTFCWNGFPLLDWIEDLRARMNKLQVASKRAKLEALEGRLNAIISPELRAELELEAIAGELQ